MGPEQTAPPSPTFLTAEWRDLAMLNYEVDPALLIKLVPPGTELDCWQGKTYISLVGFRFLKTRVRGVSLPFHRNFEEVNLRFYVRRGHEKTARRGVVFVREIVPRRMIAAVARAFYNERYVALPMSYEVQTTELGIAVTYKWKARSGWNAIRLTAAGEPSLPANESEQQFITEHYWGYSAARNGGCIEYQVQHVPWRVWTTTDARFEGDVEELYGKDLAAALERAPKSAFLAEGSPVSVHQGRNIPGFEQAQG